MYFARLYFFVLRCISSTAKWKGSFWQLREKIMAEQHRKAHKEYWKLDLIASALLNAGAQLERQYSVPSAAKKNFVLVEVNWRIQNTDCPSKTNEDKALFLAVNWLSLHWEDDTEKSLHSDEFQC